MPKVQQQKWSGQIYWNLQVTQIDTKRSPNSHIYICKRIWIFNLNSSYKQRAGPNGFTPQC